MKKIISLFMAVLLIILPSSNAFAKSTSEYDFSQLSLVNVKKFKSFDGSEIEEYYYKPSSYNSNGQAINSLSVEPYAIVPEEGDFKIVISKGGITGKDWFNTVSGYLTYLSNTGKYNAGVILSGFLSNPIASFFSSAALDLLHNGAKGSGTAYSLERKVTKWGQIYRKGEWVDYYRGTQEEVFWGQKIIVYGSDGSVIYSLDQEYLENKGYKPIYVKATNIFRDNNKVYQYALLQYQSNGYIYGDTGSVIVKTSSWLTGVDPKY